ncbi:helix-turn-helix domain-containing protein [Streptomyces sp. RFCAC02]|uniref:winged helix-turn-helix transcriptional regulator n=1 Tax=Streptomyces sp. RFCAC02 TaxID=2499143 RepID=UPI001020547D|nr:helix-turn-helix domain-containing protein [Streptomyces sp. RFCAC02]
MSAPESGFGHGTTQSVRRVGHQTVTHAPAPDGWDTGLVPDARGRTTRPDPDCPVETALTAIAGRWTTLVLRELMAGPASFGALRQRLPDLSAKVLTERLRTLEGNGLLIHERLPGFPAVSRYTLTGAGLALRPLLTELYRTGSALQSLTGDTSGG